MAGKLLLFARDPGNANQIVALHELLTEVIAGNSPGQLAPGATRLAIDLANGRTADDILIGALDAAAGVLREAGLTADTELVFKENDDLVDLFTGRDIDAIVTGLSDRDDRTPQALWQTAAKYQKRSIAIADDNTLALRHAANDLADRFTDASGARVRPDVIGVVDNESCRALVNIGIPKDAIVILGNLHLRRFRRLARSIDLDSVEAVRREWGANQSDRVILFASEPITQMLTFGKMRSYNELMALDELFERIATGNFLPEIFSKEETLVIVRPHPRDNPCKYDRFLRRKEQRAIVSWAGSSAEAVLAADTVVGISSMLLVEAATLDIPSISMIDFDPQAAARGA